MDKSVNETADAAEEAKLDNIECAPPKVELHVPQTSYNFHRSEKWHRKR